MLRKGIKKSLSHLPRQRLGTRFAVYIASILILVNICSISYVSILEKNRNLHNLRQQGAVLGQYIGTSIYRHILNHDYISLDTSLQQAMSLNGLRYIAIVARNEVYISAQAKLSSDSTPQLPIANDSRMKSRDRFAMVKKMRQGANDYIDVSSPILFADTYLGRVVIGLSLDFNRKETRKFLSMLLLINALVAVILGAGIYAFFWKRALQPINSLIEGAQRVAQGNLDCPVPLICNNELGVLIDSFNSMMTERKRAEKDSKKKQQDWERLFNAVEDVVFIQDNDMNILQANAAAGKLFNKNPDDLVGRHCYSLFMRRDEPCPNCPVLACIRDHSCHYADIEYPELGKMFHISASPIFDTDQGWTGVAHIVRDVTEQNKLEAQYRQAQKMEAIGTLAGGIAHDFNNILTPILCYAQLIKITAEPGSELEERITAVLQSSQLARDLVKQILLFSRERQHALQELQLQPVIKESMKLLRSSIPATIKIEIALDPHCGNTLADATQIHQIIMNICTNAYHAMEPSGGVLTVSLRQEPLATMPAHLHTTLTDGDYLLLQISDTGRGMDTLTRERIFEPFFTTKDEGKGTGLGLSVVHGIVKDHGGTISVESTPGSGTAFTIYLPVVSTGRVASLPANGDNLQLESTHQGNEQILVVDDEVKIATLIRRILERVGYQVTILMDSQQALELFKQDPSRFDLLITDITMPGITGLELARTVRTLRHDIPLILCSGNEGAYRKEMEENNLQGLFIAKPFTVPLLTKAVRRALDQNSPEKGNAT